MAANKLPDGCKNCEYERKYRYGDNYLDGFCKCTGAPLTIKEHNKRPGWCYLAKSKIDLKKVKKIRSVTGCPYWAIMKCLELEHGCESKAIARLEKIYAWYYNMGDYPDITLKSKELELCEEYEKYQRSHDSKSPQHEHGESR